MMLSLAAYPNHNHQKLMPNPNLQHNSDIKTRF